MNILGIYEVHQRVTKSELEEASLDELKELLRIVNQKSSTIAAALTATRSRVASLGGQIDEDWVHRATMAKKATGRLSQAIQTEIGRKGREQKQKNRQNHDATFEQLVRKAMDNVLSPELKDKVLQEVKRLNMAG